MPDEYIEFITTAPGEIGVTMEELVDAIEFLEQNAGRGWSWIEIVLYVLVGLLLLFDIAIIVLLFNIS